MEKQPKPNDRVMLGKTIKNLRTSQGLSIRRFALMIGMDYSYICKIESGDANATVDVLSKIAGGLGVNIRDLF